MEKKRLVRFVAWTSIVMVVAAVGLGWALSSALARDSGTGEVAETPPGGTTGTSGVATSVIAIAIAVSIASGTIGAGYAVGKVGSAAIGAASERPEIMGRALVFVVIAEGIAVWGLVGAILLVGRL